MAAVVATEIAASIISTDCKRREYKYTRFGDVDYDGNDVTVCH